jgi:hypothetical protein
MALRGIKEEVSDETFTAEEPQRCSIVVDIRGVMGGRTTGHNNTPISEKS